MSIMRFVGLCIIFSLLTACVTAKRVSPYPPVAPLKPTLSDATLGRKYLLGRGVVRNNEKAFYHFKRAADSGDAFAQNEVAYLYASGKGVEQDYSKALYYYQKAANQGLASAQYNVGLFYLHGLGVTPNRETARNWLEKSASHHFEPATLLLSRITAAGYVPNEG